MKKMTAFCLALGMMASLLAGCSQGTASSEESTPASTTESTATAEESSGGITSTELNIVYSDTPEVHEKEYLMNEYFRGFEEE